MRIFTTGSRKAAPPEVHGFILGQDVVDADGFQFRLYNDDFLSVDFDTARDYIVPVLKEVENNAEAIADALSRLAYDDVGAILVQDGFDLMVWYLSVGVYLDPANTRDQRNEVDGNNVINDYELVHGLTLKNLTVNPGDPLVIDDVLKPEGDAGARVNFDNLTFDYLFL